VATLRVGATVFLVAISLSACAAASGAAGPGPDSHSAQYQLGYRAGRAVRVQYGSRPGGTMQDLAAYCDEQAYLDIQPLNGALVLWSEGFNAGCQSALRLIG
jgi:hypothetical protein